MLCSILILRIRNEFEGLINDVRSSNEDKIMKLGEVLSDDFARLWWE